MTVSKINTSYSTPNPTHNTPDDPFIGLRSMLASDPVARATMQREPASFFKQHGLQLTPQDEGVAAAVGQTLLQQAAVPAGAVNFADPGYVKVEAGWLGLYVTLSNQAVSDLSNGLYIAAGVSAAIAAVAMPFPAAGQAIAIGAGAIGGCLALNSALISLMNRGNGVVLFMSWATPSLFIPTPA